MAADTTPATQAEVKSTIYLDSSADSFLNEMQFRGRQARPKVDASRSAVVRLALSRLQDQMDPDQVLRELVARAVPQTGPGRRRL